MEAMKVSYFCALGACSLGLGALLTSVFIERCYVDAVVLAVMSVGAAWHVTFDSWLDELIEHSSVVRERERLEWER